MTIRIPVRSASQLASSNGHLCPGSGRTESPRGLTGGAKAPETKPEGAEKPEQDKQENAKPDKADKNSKDMDRDQAGGAGKRQGPGEE